jgi:UDP-N-acetyl-2-amino-2-deoxyglucuronate dehydrogenase
MKKFAIIGAAGYIAPKHFKAIKATQNNLVAAYDPFDSVGIIDNYFPSANFFTEFERFERYLDKLKRENSKIDFLSVCSPNYLHDSHIRLGLKNDAHVICEKPLVLNPWNVEGLIKLENETGKKVYTILQLRLHPNILKLKQKVELTPKNKTFDVDLTYITSRGNWYYSSWKGNEAKSGGIATNIGIHFFDMLHWIFGDVKENKVHIHAHDRAAGFIEFERARVRWFLSINNQTLPEEIKSKEISTYRSLNIEGENIEFSEGFDDLHTLSYQNILKGNGSGIKETLKAIEMIHEIRSQKPTGLVGDIHPLAKLPLEKHPFKV